MNKIRLSKSSISQDEKEAVLKVLGKEYLGMGEEVKLFEEKIKNYLQTAMDVVCVNTGTSALHLALSALKLKGGDEVLVPSLTYVASYQAISATGAKPISCEINPNTLFLDFMKRCLWLEDVVIMCPFLDTHWGQLWFLESQNTVFCKIRFRRWRSPQNDTSIQAK